MLCNMAASFSSFMTHESSFQDSHQYLSGSLKAFQPLLCILLYPIICRISSASPAVKYSLVEADSDGLRFQHLRFLNEDHQPWTTVCGYLEPVGLQLVLWRLLGRLCFGLRSCVTPVQLSGTTALLAPQDRSAIDSCNCAEIVTWHWCICIIMDPVWTGCPINRLIFVSSGQFPIFPSLVQGRVFSWTPKKAGSCRSSCIGLIDEGRRLLQVDAVPSMAASRHLLQSNAASLPNTLSHSTSCQLQNIQGFSSPTA